MDTLWFLHVYPAKILLPLGRYCSLKKKKKKPSITFSIYANELDLALKKGTHTKRGFHDREEDYLDFLCSSLFQLFGKTQ